MFNVEYRIDVFDILKRLFISFEINHIKDRSPVLGFGEGQTTYNLCLCPQNGTGAVFALKGTTLPLSR